MALEFYGLKYSPPCWAALSLGHHMGLEFNFHEVDILTAKHLEEDFVKVTFIISYCRGSKIFTLAFLRS